MKRLGRVGFLEHISSRVGVLLMSEMFASVLGVSICVIVHVSSPDGPLMWAASG